MMPSVAWLPHPLLSAVLVVVWLLLVNSVSIGHVLLGSLLGVLVPLFTHALWPGRPRIYRRGRLLRYGAMVMWDIVVANLEVAKWIVGPQDKLRPAFVEVPMDLTDEFAITVFTGTVSLTPGTVSAEVSSDRRTLLIHALNVADPDELVATIKRRYEAPLKEIFECSP